MSDTLPFAQIPNFLTAEENQRVLQYALDNQGLFVPTSTSTGAEDYRISKVLFSFEPVRHLVTNKLPAVMQQVCPQLCIEEFEVGQIESQMTATLDGGFYKSHTDNGCDISRTRVVTYVYYFYKEPKRFAGGELWIYSKGKRHPVTPRNNTLIVFSSGLSHEVRPVASCDSSFESGRHTINGWVRRQERAPGEPDPEQLTLVS